MSPYAYVRAHAKDNNIRAIASHIANGTESYGAYILTREDSSIRRSPIRGKALRLRRQALEFGVALPSQPLSGRRHQPAH